MKRIICIVISIMIFFSQNMILFATETISSFHNQESMISFDTIDQNYKDTDWSENEIEEKVQDDEIDRKEDINISQIQKLQDSSELVSEERKNIEKQEQKQPVEDDDDELRLDSTKIDVEDDQIKEESVVGIQEENDDPQLGRENGWVYEQIDEGVPFSARAQYIHNNKFDDHIVYDVIDVSKYQGDVDWNKVKQSGIDYAMIRIGYRGYGEEGTLNKDEKYENNIKNAISAGIKVGVYFFSQAITEDEAIAEANHVLNWIGNNEISLPITIDFEYASNKDGVTGRLYNANLTKEEGTNICSAFCEVIKDAGYSPMIYANKHMLENGIDAALLEEKYEIWIANYNYKNSYNGKYSFWQYSQKGSVEGISGNVDKNFWYIKPEIKYIEVEEGIYTINSCLDEKKVLDIADGGLQNGANVQLYKNNETWAQKFYIRTEAEGTYIIMSANSGKVLTVKDSAFKNEARICQADYTGEDSQRWRFRESADGCVIIESAFANLILDVKYGSIQDGTPIQLYEFNDTKAQKFKLVRKSDESIQKIKNGCYAFATFLNNKKIIGLDVTGMNLEIRASELSKNQKFRLKYIGGGCYKIISLANEKILSADEGENLLLLNEEAGDNSQKWLIKSYADSCVAIISAKDGMNLDVHFASTADGTPIQKYTGNGSKAQKFQLFEVDEKDVVVEDGIYIIHSALSDKKVIDVQSGALKSGANVQLYASNGTRAQQFMVKHLADGTYSIKSYNSEMAISIQGSNIKNEANVVQDYPSDKIEQKWKIVKNVDGYYSVLTVSGNKALDVKYANTADGTNIHIYEYNKTKAQKFRFEKVSALKTNEEKKLENGTYLICASNNEGKVLDIDGGSLYMGANVQLYTSNNTSAQQFVIQKNKDNELYTITSKRSGLKLTYKDGILQNDVNVYQSTSMGEVGNQWKIKHIAGDYYMLYAGESKYCIDIRWGSMQDKTNIQIYEDNKSAAQIFKLKKINNQTKTEKNESIDLKEGIYTISSALDRTMVIDVENASLQSGANIQLYKKNNSKAQQFIVKKSDNGNYTINSLVSGKMMSIQNANIGNGANVCQMDVDELNSQQWKIVSAGNGYYAILTQQGNMAVDVKYAETKNGTNIHMYESNGSAAQRFVFETIQTYGATAVIVNENEIKYETLLGSKVESADEKYYLMKTDSTGKQIEGEPFARVSKDFAISVRTNSLKRNCLKELLMGKVALAIKDANGEFKLINEPISIYNPETLASNTTEIYQGTSKKGIQGVTFTSLDDNAGGDILDARNANTKHTLMNLDLSKLVSLTPKEGFEAYTYKGKTYYFDELVGLRASINSLNTGYKQYLYGSSDTTKVAVTMCLLLGYNPEISYLIDPAVPKTAYKEGSYYLMNVRDEKARETFEALFLYLGEAFGKGDQYTENSCYVSNWILGNEINSSKAWNISGNLDFDTYIECYATAFRLLYNGVKSEKTGNTVSISLDNGWTAVPNTYAGKTTLDTFAKKIHEQNPNIQWSVAYHPYSYPLTKVDFWNDYSNTTDSLSTKYISMRNISVLTNYVATLEKTYGLPTGSIRVLLTEQGYSHSGGAEEQAMAIARGYYIAQFNNRIDAFIIRSLVDDKDEAANGLYFGIANSRSDKRIAFYVYEHMDSNLDGFKQWPDSLVTSQNREKFNKAKGILCDTIWGNFVPGFNKQVLASIK